MKLRKKTFYVDGGGEAGLSEELGPTATEYTELHGTNCIRTPYSVRCTLHSLQMTIDKLQTFKLLDRKYGRVQKEKEKRNIMAGGQYQHITPDAR